jgi:uncharacterized protein YdeI (YjbR/CyaY-like superfamily)
LGETGTVRRVTTQKIAGSTVHKLPADFRKAIESNAAAKSVWTDITPTGAKRVDLLGHIGQERRD